MYVYTVDAFVVDDQKYQRIDRLSAEILTSKVAYHLQMVVGTRDPCDLGFRLTVAVPRCAPNERHWPPKVWPSA